MTTRWQHFSLPNSIPWATRALGEVPFLGCDLEWDVPETTAKGLCLLISSTLPFTTPDKSKPLQTCYSEGAEGTLGRVSLRQKVGDGNTPTRRPENRVNLQSSSIHPWDFPGSSVVKIHTSRARGPSSICGWRTERLRSMWCGQENC